MTREDAVRVLCGMEVFTFRNDKLWNQGENYVSAGTSCASLDGEFTADQLEAIAAWMRDPTIADIKA